MKEIHENVWREGEKLFTKNLVPGETVYSEKTKDIEGEEYREWDANRSKLGAAVMKGMPVTGLENDSRVLYLGAASGTTVSHVSDICSEGVVVAVEYSSRVVIDLLRNSKNRENLCPVLSDARKPDEYMGMVGEVDMVFQDVAQPDQVKIFKKNCRKFLKDGGVGVLAVKARSISSSEPVEKVLEEQRKKLEKDFEVEWSSRLEPFEKDHVVFLVRNS